MYEHVAESYVCVSNSRRLVDEVCARIAYLCLAVTGDVPVRTLIFEEGTAIIRATEDRLLLWIGASSLLMRHSLQVAIESSLLHVMSRGPTAIPWHRGEDTPFAVIERLLEKPQATSTALKVDRAHTSLTSTVIPARMPSARAGRGAAFETSTCAVCRQPSAFDVGQDAIAGREVSAGRADFRKV